MGDHVADELARSVRIGLWSSFNYDLLFQYDQQQQQQNWQKATHYGELFPQPSVNSINNL